LYTKIGDQIFYEDAQLGAAPNENDPRGETLYLTFADPDNEEIHLVPISISKLEQYFALIRKTATQKKIETPGGTDGRG
jgi:hypothetical protein